MTPHVSTTLLRTQTDERLVELIAVGHDRAFEAVVDRYRRPLLRYARRFIPEEARAEDVVQAAFVSAWGALRDGAPVRDLRPWLYRIVHNGALTAMKKPGGDDAPLIEASDLRPGPAAAVEQREDVRAALDTIAGLPDRQRAALLAVAFEGRSHADVGAELGLNDTAVRQLVSRARSALRVAATAVTPWPVAVWLAGVGGPQAADSATRVGEIVGGVGAGTIFGGSAMKAGAIVAAAGAVAVSVPKVDHAVRERHRPAAAQAAERPSASGGAPAGASGPATTRISAPAAPDRSAPSSGASENGSGRSGGDDRASGGGRGEGPGPGERSTPGGSGDDAQDHEGDRETSGVEDGPRNDASAEAPRSGRREHRSSGNGDVREDDHGEDPDVPEQPEPEVAREQPQPVEDSSETSWSSGSSGSSESSGSGSATTEQAETEDSHDDDDDDDEHVRAP